MQQARIKRCRKPEVDIYDYVGEPLTRLWGLLEHMPGFQNLRLGWGYGREPSVVEGTGAKNDRI